MAASIQPLETYKNLNGWLAMPCKVYELAVREIVVRVFGESGKNPVTARAIFCHVCSMFLAENTVFLKSFGFVLSKRFLCGSPNNGGFVGR